MGRKRDILILLPLLLEVQDRSPLTRALWPRLPPLLVAKQHSPCLGPERTESSVPLGRQLASG